MTTTTKQNFIGIDISKANLDVAIWGSEVFWRLENNVEELQKLAQRMKELTPSLIVLEASGGLEHPVAR